MGVMKKNPVTLKTKNNLSHCPLNKTEREVDYEHDRRAELGSTEKQLQLSGWSGTESVTSGFQVQRPNHSATLPASFAASFNYRHLIFSFPDFFANQRVNNHTSNLLQVTLVLVAVTCEVTQPLSSVT